ncbi:hypothetical protein ACHAWF_018802, partial [Thalassiosira exigua]
FRLYISESFRFVDLSCKDSNSAGERASAASTVNHGGRPIRGDHDASSPSQSIPRDGSITRLASHPAPRSTLLCTDAMPRPPRSSRRNYNRLSAGSGLADGASSPPLSSSLDEPLSPASSSEEGDGGGRAAVRRDGDPRLEEGDGGADGAPSSSSSAALLPPVLDGVDVTLMDSAQSKFRIRCDPRWKVSEFKEASAAVTKVPPRSQRLIHMGKLLRDDATLGESGIDEDDKIIHLFPKPNVVINAGGGGEGSRGADDDRGEADDRDGDGGATEGGGAHVPQIILDAEEASRRSQILILSSQEIFEAQHRVKIFSFLLMIVCSMELLTLMTLFVGMQAEDPTGYGGGSGGGSAGPPPGNPTDAPPSTGTDTSLQMRMWQDSDYFDAAISSFGFYVSLLGIKATTENTLSLARQYFLCLVAAGIGFNAYYYYMNVAAEQKHARERDQRVDGGELYTTAFLGILLPLTVWTLCIVRAHQFQSLIREAEREAEERTRGLDGGDAGDDGDGGDGGGAGSEAPRSLPYGSDDLELAVERGVSS